MKSKKLLATLLASTMVLTSFAACQSAPAESSSSKPEISKEEGSNGEEGKEMIGNIYVEGLPIAKEPVTYKIMNSKPASDQSVSQNDKEIMKISTKDTNINIEWTETSDVQFDEQVNMILSTGQNMPDAFRYWPSEADVAKNINRYYAISDEYLELLTPNINALVQEHVDGGWDIWRKADGKVYSLATGNLSQYISEAGAITYYRKDLAEKDGVTEIKSTDDIYEMLKGFKDEEGIVYPYLFAQNNWSAKLQAMAGSWGMAGRNLNNDSWFGRVVDGKYDLKVDEQCFRDFVTEMAKWYADGLIPIDGFTVTNAEHSARNNQTSTYGMATGWAPNVEEWDAGLWAALPVVPAPGYEGQEVRNGEKDPIHASLNGFMITSTCEQPEGLLRWYDHCHQSAEWRRISSFGEEGQNWVLAEDGVTAYLAVPDLTETIPDENTYDNTFAWCSASCLMFPGDRPLPDPNKTIADTIRYAVGPGYEPFYAPELIPTTTIIPVDAADDFAFYKTDFEETVQNFMATGVRDGVTDESWNAYINTLNSFNIDEWCAYYQHIIDDDFEA